MDRRRLHRRHRLVLSHLLLATAGCGPTAIDAVDLPDGPYRPNAGCGVIELGAGGAVCPTGAQFTFEKQGDEQAFRLGKNLTARQLSCERSYCGTGSLKVRATYTWPDGAPRPVDGAQLGEVIHTFPRPVDLYGKRVSFQTYVDPFDTPFNAQLAIEVQGRGWTKIQDGPISNRQGWNLRGDIVAPENPDTGLPANTRQVMATAIFLQVYLSRPVGSGDRRVWVGDVYFDDVKIEDPP